MLKLVRSSHSTTESTSKEPNSATLPTTVKRGFKSNASAAFLKKRMSVDLNSEGAGSLDFLEAKTKSETTTDCSDSNSEQEISESKENTDKQTKSLELKPGDPKDTLPDSVNMKCLKEKYFRVMVIGSRDIGKHSFVHSLFPEKNGEVCMKKQYFDLITKATADDEYIRRYNFWLKEPSDAQKDYRYIMDVYYRTCSVFFLLYNPEDVNSMEILEKELALLRNTQQNLDRCKIVLLANKKCSDSEIISIEKIKEKFSDKIYLETVNMPESNELLLKIIESSTKCDETNFGCSM